MSGLGPHRATPDQLRRRLALEARGTAFLILDAGPDGERLHPLDAATTTIGRGLEVDLALDGDDTASRLHAQIERTGGAFVLLDDGLSANGTWVEGTRVAGRRRLRDGDELRFGATRAIFRQPGAEAIGDTRPAAGDGPAPELTDAQRRVLVALCRPYRHGDAYARPATAREICAEVHLGPDAVRTHLRALFEKLAVEDLPGGEKRLRLVELALRRGAVTARGLAAQI